MEVLFFAQDVSQPQPAKVVILSERGQEKSAKDASLSRIVLEKSATPVNSSEGLRLGMMLSQQAAGRRVLGLRKARASKSPGRVSSACTFFSTHQWPNGPQGWVWASPWPLGAPLASPLEDGAHGTTEASRSPGRVLSACTFLVASAPI